MFFNGLISEAIKFVKGLDPIANAFAGTVTTPGVNLGLYERAAFKVNKGVGATGTTLITVEACTDSAGTSPVAIPFTYRRCNSTDTLGSPTAATSAGFTTTAGSSEFYVIEVKASDLPDPKSYVRLKAVEGVVSAVAGSIDIVLMNPRYGGLTMPTAL